MAKFRSIKQLSLSAFVVSSFLVYALRPQEIAPKSASVDQDSTHSNTLQVVSRSSRKVYRDGTYIGTVVKAGYGRVQVQAVIKNGRISSIQFLDYPNQLQTSQKINARAMPRLQQEAIQSQNAQVDAVSGATVTSQAFSVSLQAALDFARQ